MTTTHTTWENILWSAENLGWEIDDDNVTVDMSDDQSIVLNHTTKLCGITLLGDGDEDYARFWWNWNEMDVDARTGTIAECWSMLLRQVRAWEGM